MIDLLVSNWDSVLVVILFLILIIYLIRRDQVKKVNEMLFYLVTVAENEFGNGTGVLKYAAVTTWLYDRLPAIFKILITDKQLDKMIEKSVVDMKEYLKD